MVKLKESALEGIINSALPFFKNPEYADYNLAGIAVVGDSDREFSQLKEEFDKRGILVYSLLQLGLSIKEARERKYYVIELDKLEVEEKVLKEIENGTVIDHLPGDTVFRLEKILRLSEQTRRIHLGYNYDSKKLGKKGILKIEGKYLSDYEISLVGVVAPGATLNVIKDRQVIGKRKVYPPRVLARILKCPNPDCVTNVEREHVETRFYYDNDKLACDYCERKFLKGEVISSTFPQAA